MVINKPISPILTIIGLIQDGRRLFAGSLVLLAVAGVGSSLAPLFLGTTLNQLIGLTAGRLATTQAEHHILLLLTGYLALRAVTGIFDWTGSLAGNRLSYNLRGGLRHRVINQLMDLPIDFFEQQRLGEIIEKIGTGIGDLTNWIQNVLGFFFSQLINLIVSLVVITRIEPGLGLGLLVVITGNTWYKYHARRTAQPLLKAARTDEELASGLATESLANLTTVRAFGQEANLIGRIRQALDRYVHHQYQADQHLERAFWAGEYLVLTGTVVGLGVIALGVLHGRHTPGELLLAIIYFQNIASNSRPLGRLITGTIQTSTSAGRLVDVLNEPATVLDRPGARPLPRLGTIEFDHVSFRYPSQTEAVLDDISFTLPAGQTLALVGPSGVGKTTITKLLLRYYEPTAGRILIDGRDITEFTQASIRARLGIVMQDVALFNGTIRANLSFAKPEATEAEIQAAAHTAHADAFIDHLPTGYDTVVGERGIRLSGGEKQRVAVARAILRNPQLIILDEATSALDSESERFVQDGLTKLLSHRTALIIAHRLSTVMKADQILVLERGRIVDRGTHRTLTGRQTGLYARLFKLQTEGALLNTSD